MTQQTLKTSEHLKLVRDAHYKLNWTYKYNYLCFLSQRIAAEESQRLSPVTQILNKKIGHSGAHVFYTANLPEDEYDLPGVAPHEFALLYPLIGFKANLARFVWLSLLITEYESKGD